MPTATTVVRPAPRRAEGAPADPADQRRLPQHRERQSTRRRMALSLAVVVTALALLTAAVATVVTVQDAPVRAGIGTAVPVGGLELTVSSFDRRVDSMSGSNATQLPMSGPGMPTSSMGGAAPHDDAAAEGGSMPSMAGMLEQGQERVDVSVSVSNTTGESAQLDARKFRLFSGDREVELLQPTASDIAATAVPAGFTTNGKLTFVIADGTSPLELRYADETGRILLDGSAAEADGDAPHGDPHD